MSQKYFFVLILFLIPVLGSAQNIDTANCATIYVFDKNNFFNQSKIDSLKIDTTINVFHKYSITDTLVAFQFLGSPGLAFNISEILLNENINESYFFNQNLNYFPDNSFLIIGKKRFTNLQYVIGSKKEQYLSVLHSQNIIRGLNASIIYQRLSADGFFRRQSTKLSQFEFFPWYETKNYRYAIYTSLIVKDLQIQENGGLISDTALSELSDLNLLDINLLDAQNKTRKFGFSISQKANLGKNVDGYRTFSHSIVHKLSYSDEKNTFTDSDPTNQFYFTTFYDTTLTNDDLRIFNFNNLLRYTLQASTETSLSLYAVNDMLEVKQKTLDTLFNNLTTGTEIFYKWKLLNINLKGEYCADGPSEGNFLINPILNLELFNNYSFSLSYLNKVHHPDILFRIFQSNHFSWYNYLEKIESQKFDLKVHSANINTTVYFKFLNLKNFTYLNEIAKPEQFPGNLNYISIHFKNLLRFGKFGVESNGIWQQVNNEEIVKLPNFGFVASLYFEDKLFKNALQTKSGIEVNYISTFKGDKYMPPLRNFYLQNEIDVGGFTQLDLFINFKIKTARVFLKIENITSEGSNDFDYTVPGYPLPGRLFKVGVNWMFFD